MFAVIKEQLTSVQRENSLIQGFSPKSKEWCFGQEVDPLMRAAAALTCSLTLANGVRLLCLL